MRPERFFHSLRFKITVGIAVPLLVILSAYSYLQYVRQRDLLLTNLDRAAANLGNIIVGSLHHAMLQRDLSEIQDIVNNVGNETEVRNVFLMNDRNEVRFAPLGQNVGVRFTLNDPGCAACHASNLAEHPSSVVLATPGSETVLRSCTPIGNQPECQSCHGTQNQYNGVLITDLSMQPVNESLDADLRTNIFWASAAILTTILLVNALMSRLVVTKIERLVEALKQFSRGDLSQRVRIPGGDEIGELAVSFNRMAEGLGEKALLEARVLEHTHELERLYDELRRKETLRRQLLDKLITAQEEERKRIARDLHDQLGATLSGLTLSIEAVGQSLPPQAESLKERWWRTQVLAVQALEETHKLLLGLRPVVLDDLGLVAAIRAEAQEHLQARGIDAQMTATGLRQRLAPELELALFRIVQEAINNVARHAHAHRVTITFNFEETRVRVTVEDDGQGFDLQAMSSSGNGTRGLGLLGMAERVELMGGSLEIETQLGRGTRIRITAPTSEKEEP